MLFVECSLDQPVWVGSQDMPDPAVSANADFAHQVQARCHRPGLFPDAAASYMSKHPAVGAVETAYDFVRKRPGLTAVAHQRAHGCFVEAKLESQ